MEIEEQTEMLKHPNPLLKYFVYRHLPSQLQEVSKKFADLAWDLEKTLPNCPQKQFCLQELLVAKDAAVRSAL